MDDWYTTIPDILFTRIKYALCDASDAPFPDLICSTDDIDPDDPEFPLLFLQTLGLREMGRDIENQYVNAVNYAGQITVYTDEDEQASLLIANEAVRVLKGLRFNIAMLPMPYRRDNIFYASFRFSRVVGAQDGF